MSEDDPPEAIARSRSQRVAGFEGIMREQFQLSYFGKISYEATEQMTVQERKAMFAILLEQKNEEKKQHDEAMKAAKAKSAAKRH